MKLFMMKLPIVISSFDFNILIKKVSPSKQLKLKRYINKRDMYSSLLSELIVRRELFKKLSICNKDIEFEYGENGKPYVDYDNCEFNMSHSGDYVLCGLDDSKIGVDIEQVRYCDFYNIDRVFSDNEKELFYNKLTDKESMFYRTWVLKETYLKATGIGFSINVKSIDLDLNNPRITYGGWFFKEYDLMKNYKIAVCSESGLFTNEITYLDNNNIVDMFKNLKDIEI